MSGHDERLFPACRLWERTGRNGNPYLSGRWGGARVLIVRNPDRADEDDATFLLVLGPADPAPRKKETES